MDCKNFGTHSNIGLRRYGQTSRSKFEIHGNYGQTIVWPVSYYNLNGCTLKSHGTNVNIDDKGCRTKEPHLAT